jgi:glycosyltransferase involved in cell wall biosynthesis
MKIGFDLRPLQSGHRYRGIGTYLTNLVKATADKDTRNTYIFFVYRGDNPLSELSLPKSFDYEVAEMAPPRLHLVLSNIKATFFGWQPPVKTDVIFAPDISFGLPKTDAPIVSVCYDLMPHLFRDHIFPRSARHLIKQAGIKGLVGSYLRRTVYDRQQKQLTRASRIIAISEATKRDLLDYLPSLKAGAITVVPLAASALPAPAGVVPASLGVHAPYLLYVGGADWRKNVASLVAAFNKLRPAHPDLQLVLVGKDFDDASRQESPEMWQAIDASPNKSAIVRLGYQSDANLAALYAEATCFVFPSLYEGFGMPVLEAMQAGSPVIAYDNSSIAEVAGEAAMLLDDKEPLDQAVAKLLADPKLREDLVARGKLQAKKFSWQQTAAATIKVLRKHEDRS